MLTTKRWLRMVVTGLLLTGCGGAMEPVPGEGQQGEAPADIHASTTTSPTTGSTPPAAVMLPVRDMRALWPSTASVRRYVVLVAYTLPPTTTGSIPPPRFRAFGIDMSTRQYLFSVDGERATYLGSFTEAMLQKGAVVIATPPGMKFDGSCSALPVATVSESGEVSASTLEADCGTDPVVRSGGSTNTGGNDWNFSWAQVMNLSDAVNGLFGEAHYADLSRNMNSMGAPEAVEAR